MEKFLVKGGRPLSGEINIGGAKNAAVAILPATVMARGRCIIENVPDISDVRVLLDILSQLGAKIEKISNDTVAIDTTELNGNEVPYELAVGPLQRIACFYAGRLQPRRSSHRPAS